MVAETCEARIGMPGFVECAEIPGGVMVRATVVGVGRDFEIDSRNECRGVGEHGLQVKPWHPASGLRGTSHTLQSEAVGLSKTSFESAGGFYRSSPLIGFFVRRQD
jgi:hypothetical protein